MDIACSGVAERILAHNDFDSALKRDQVAGWWGEVTTWEADPVNTPNPFDLTIATPSQSAVRKALSDEEALDKETSKRFSLEPGMSPSTLISRGMDLESEMYAALSFSLPSFRFLTYFIGAR